MADQQSASRIRLPFLFPWIFWPEVVACQLTISPQCNCEKYPRKKERQTKKSLLFGIRSTTTATAEPHLHGIYRSKPCFAGGLPSPISEYWITE